MREEKGARTITEQFDQPYIKIASEQVYNLMDEREMQRELQDRSRRNLDKRVAMSYKDLQDVIIGEI
jgi:hypothetical protein